MVSRASKTLAGVRPLEGSEASSRQPADQDKLPPVGPVLRRARKHHQLSLREVERRIGRSNAYLSQVERGLIKQPDLVVLLELAELYGLDFTTLAAWAHWVPSDRHVGTAGQRGDSTGILVRYVLELDAKERAQVLSYIESLLRERRT